jgi:hypothetical protein
MRVRRRVFEPKILRRLSFSLSKAPEVAVPLPSDFACSLEAISKIELVIPGDLVNSSLQIHFTLSTSHELQFMRPYCTPPSQDLKVRFGSSRREPPVSWRFDPRSRPPFAHRNDEALARAKSTAFVMAITLLGVVTG